MPDWEDLINQGVISPKAYAKWGQPLPSQELRDLPSGATQSLAQAMPPASVRDMLAGAAEPFLKAGNYLGGLMQGSQRFSWPETVQHAGALAMAMAPGPKGERVAGALERGLGKAAAEAAPGIKAYHGSPHDFERFDLSKIGTGEGAQAYGHGLYFAENEGVAKDYRRRLATAKNDPQNIRPDEQAITDHRGTWDALVQQRRAKTDVNPSADTSDIDRAMDAIHQQMIDDTVKRNPKLSGRMYEVNIRAHPEQFLDWDKPLSEQSDYVRSILQKHPAFETIRDVHSELTPRQIAPSTSTGIETFREAGIPGIRYLDQGSRKPGISDLTLAQMDARINSLQQDIAGGGGNQQRMNAELASLQNERANLTRPQTHNYVVFNDQLIDILKKYGLAGLIAGGGYHAQMPARQ